jgi:transposase-like protein
VIETFASLVALTQMGRNASAVAVVSTQQRTKRTDMPDCPRCKAAAMSDIVTIPPTLHQPGLIAYECSKCGYVTSVLVQPPDD